MKKKFKIPKQIFAQVSPKSIGGTSLFTPGNLPTSENVHNYYSEKTVQEKAVERLKNAGFTVIGISSTTINISGSESTYKKAFGVGIVARELPVIKGGPNEETATFLDTLGNDTLGLIEPKEGVIADVIEGVAIETPYYYFAPNALPPTKSYWHLNVPADVSLGCNADRAHRVGITGKGIRVAMVDSGWYRHPFFTSRGYRANPAILAPGASQNLVDNNGHGTAESANIFSIAPDSRLIPVKMHFANATGAFNKAVAQKPNIITCSWGQHIVNGPLNPSNQALAAAVASAVAAGIVVVFAAGNGHYGFPGQHPDVISAGGVYMDQNGNLQASTYSSGFNSNIYNNRVVPDVCGLVGMFPNAKYIMLPLQSGSSIDVSGSGGSFPTKDETKPKDGWAAISGTSAAAPQLAGLAALLLQVCPRLTPRQIRSIMKRSATDIVTGNNIQGNPSVPGPDNSTGHGLINAYWAVLWAKLRCWRRPPIGIPVRIPPIKLPLPIPQIPIESRIESEPTSRGDAYLTEEDLEEIMEMIDLRKLQ